MSATQEKFAPSRLASGAHKIHNHTEPKTVIRDQPQLFREVQRYGLANAYSRYLKRLINGSGSNENERRLAKLNKLAVQTFGSIEQADRWLRSPNRALGGKIPFELAGTEKGGRAVRQILGRIEHGVYS